MRTLDIFMLLLVICAVSFSAELDKRSINIDDDAAILEVLRNAVRRAKENNNEFLETEPVGANRRMMNWW